MSTFSTFYDELARSRVDIHPSELHGLLIGHLCAVKQASSSGKRKALYEVWLGSNPNEALAKLLEDTYAQVDDSLGEYSDFDFRLMTPEDTRPINERAEGVALWCSGFLSGYGESGRFDDLEGEAKKNVQEALQDLGRVAAMTDEVPDDEENETDLYEIEEFVRVSTLLIYAESTARETH